MSSTESKSARKKCLFSSDTKDYLTYLSSRNSTGTADNVDVNTDYILTNVLSKINIDGLKTCEGRSSLKSLKVLLVHPNGNIVTRNPTNEKTVQIIRNLVVVGGWTAVANAVFDHPVSNALHTFSNRRC